MKLSTSIKNATQHQLKAKELLEPFNVKIAEILQDDCAHFSYNPWDGFVVAYNGGMDNSAVLFLDVDKLLTLDKPALLYMLDLASI